MNINPIDRKLIEELHEFDRHKKIAIVRSIGNYGFLVHFEVDGYKMSSFDIVDYGGKYAESIHVTQRKHEASMIEQIEKDIKEFEEESEIVDIESSCKDEYVIQSNQENADDGSWYGNTDLIDNVDMHRWFDDHEGEIWEH